MGEDVIRMNKDDDRFLFNSLTRNGVYFTDRHSNQIINLLDAKACWWRRTGLSFSTFSRSQSSVKSKENIDISNFTSSHNPSLFLEYRRLREFIYDKIYNNCKINIGAPVFDFNRLKVFELAKKCGLSIPEYDIITSYAQLETCKRKWGGIVTKAISNGLYEDINNFRYYTYTELVDDILMFEIAKTESYFPSLVTKAIEKKYEIRSFYLDEHFFSMAIFSQSNEHTKTDFRKYEDNRVEPYKLPQKIENITVNLFHKLNFNCGSVDFILDKDGNYIFLEINPVGQFGMTDYPCNYNLDYIIAKYLKDGEITKDIP